MSALHRPRVLEVNRPHNFLTSGASDSDFRETTKISTASIAAFDVTPSTSTHEARMPTQSGRIPASFFSASFPRKADSAPLGPDVLDSIRSRAFVVEPPRTEAPTDTIPRLREAISSLNSKMATLMSQREELQSHLERAVRMQSPVLRLPSELLSSIFVMAVTGIQDDPVLVSTLMLVCRYWADVAINSPLLWSSISISTHNSVEKARRKLLRSKSAPLDVSINFSPRIEHSNGVTESIIHAMDLVRPALWRIRSLRLSVPNRPQAHAALLRCREDAPLLAVLSVRIFHSMQDDHYSSPHMPLFNGHTPRLISCSFTSFNFGWDFRLLTGLRVLKLGGYWNGFSPSVDTLLKILRQCPHLEEIALRNMSDVDPDSDSSFEKEWSTVKSVHLPRLTKASFYYAGILRTRMLLSQLSFPALESLEFCYLDNVTPLLGHLKNQALTSLPLRHIRLESSFFNELKLVNLLQRLTSLTTLELVDVEDASANLLKGLSTPASSQPWTCPRLESLSLDGCTNVEWDSLRAFIESRLSSNASSHSAPSHSRSRSKQTSTASAAAFMYSRALVASPGTLAFLTQPSRIHSIDVTRCHQISREGLQWLKMYVPEVRCETAKSVWGEPVMP